MNITHLRSPWKMETHHPDCPRVGCDCAAQLEHAERLLFCLRKFTRLHVDASGDFVSATRVEPHWNCAWDGTEFRDDMWPEDREACEAAIRWRREDFPPCNHGVPFDALERFTARFRTVVIDEFDDVAGARTRSGRFVPCSHLTRAERTACESVLAWTRAHSPATMERKAAKAARRARRFLRALAAEARHLFSVGPRVSAHMGDRS